MFLEYFQLGLEKLSVDMPNTTHKLVIVWKVTLEFVWKTGIQSLFLTAVFGHKLNFDWANPTFDVLSLAL